MWLWLVENKGTKGSHQSHFKSIEHIKSIHVIKHTLFRAVVSIVPWHIRYNNKWQNVVPFATFRNKTATVNLQIVYNLRLYL